MAYNKARSLRWLGYVKGCMQACAESQIELSPKAPTSPVQLGSYFGIHASFANSWRPNSRRATPRPHARGLGKATPGHIHHKKNIRRSRSRSET